jgi:hypothetical protein
MRTIIAFLFTLITPVCLFAKCEKEVYAKCATQSGWSDCYMTQATFETGDELNIILGTTKYDKDAAYAVIIRGEGTATIIKLSNNIICGPQIDCSCLTSVYGDLQGIDQHGTNWKMCTGSCCD